MDPMSQDRIKQETLDFGQLERNLAITDITYYEGEIFVAGGLERRIRFEAAPHSLSLQRQRFDVVD